MEAKCYFYEQSPGRWFAAQPSAPTLGPFGTFGEARRALVDCVLGDYQVAALPGCKHDLIVRRERFHAECDRCGRIFREANNTEGT
jgi:hypothetical protein